VDIKRAVSEFVVQGVRLFDHMRSEGTELTHVDLHMLRVQLHVLEIETGNLQTLKQLQEKVSRSEGDTNEGEQPQLL